MENLSLQEVIFTLYCLPPPSSPVITFDIIPHFVLFFSLFLFLSLPSYKPSLQVNEWNKNDERLLAAVEHGEVEKVASLLAKKGASAVKLDSEGKSA